MNITPIYVVWIASSLVQLGVLLRMWWIRAEIKFPIFFSYILLQVAKFPFAFLFYRRSVIVPGNFYFNFLFTG